MKLGFYPKLAWSGMRKNSKLYVPYTLAGAGMAALFYIISYLSSSESLLMVGGGGNIAIILGMGKFVIAVFSLLFLFYTNSFLVRRRYKEFGLYNVLGMNKMNISRILLWETLINALISIGGGVLLGIVFSKLAELGLLNMIGSDVDFTLGVSAVAIIFTVGLFGAIYLLIYLNAVIRINLSSATELVKSETAGEKPPKANWLLGIAGVVILGAAYYIAVSIKSPLTAITLFFFAVIMVIIATYLVFIAGSVLMCRILQKNKGYYYKKNHFVSVSSMSYRMKRNGAGLASICILATMVLVMISSTTCLYFGTEDSLRARYPRNVNVSVWYNEQENMSDESVSAYRDKINAAAADVGIDNVLDYRSIATSGVLVDGGLRTGEASITNDFIFTYSSIAEAYIIPLSDYNAMSETKETLSDDEALVFAYRTDYTSDIFAVDDGTQFKVKKVLDSMPCYSGDAMASIATGIYVVVSDKSFAEGDFTSQNGSSYSWKYGFDTALSDDEEMTLAQRIYGVIDRIDENSISSSVESIAQNRAEFYELYGGLFFLGIILSIAFICAAVLIIYYKQISEGYEDQARFDIMQKVGMTKKNIRRSINSQLMTVFYMPFVFACIHLAFAFPMIEKILRLFNLNNVWLFAFATVISVAVFALLYTLVYRATSNAYYAIVSGAREERA